MSAAKAPPKTPEELDEEERREVESKLKEVLDLMTARHHRDRVDGVVRSGSGRRGRRLRLGLVVHAGVPAAGASKSTGRMVSLGYQYTPSASSRTVKATRRPRPQGPPAQRPSAGS